MDDRRYREILRLTGDFAQFTCWMHQDIQACKDTRLGEVMREQAADLAGTWARSAAHSLHSMQRHLTQWEETDAQ